MKRTAAYPAAAFHQAGNGLRSSPASPYGILYQTHNVMNETKDKEHYSAPLVEVVGIIPEGVIAASGEGTHGGYTTENWG